MEGDHAGGRSGNPRITVPQAEHLGFIASPTGGAEIAPAALRRNCIVSGIDLVALQGECFGIGDVVLQGTGLAHACSPMEEALGPGGCNAMRAHGGLCVRVARGRTYRRQTAMLTEQRGIDAPASVAWRLLIDTREWSRWGPSVRAVDAPARCIGPGARGRVQTAASLWLPFEITDWQPERYWAWRVGGVPATGHAVEPIGPNHCRVRFLIPRWAPFYRPVCRQALRRIAALAEGRGVPGRSDP